MIAWLIRGILQAVRFSDEIRSCARGVGRPLIVEEPGTQAERAVGPCPPCLASEGFEIDILLLL